MIQPIQPGRRSALDCCCMEDGGTQSFNNLYIYIYIYNPLIGLNNNLFDNLKSKISGFPAGFDHFGPQIRIPREKLCI